MNFAQLLSAVRPTKMPFSMRHFVETIFLLRKDRSTHSMSIISMSHTYILVCLCDCQGNALVPSHRIKSHGSCCILAKKAPVSQFSVDKY
jgi:hypothetical protein